MKSQLIIIQINEIWKHHSCAVKPVLFNLSLSEFRKKYMYFGCELKMYFVTERSVSVGDILA